jgi:serine/threonine protein kinase
MLVDLSDDGPLGGRYRLGARLGAGAAATVYVAEDLRLLRRVAVKVYRPMPDARSLSRFAAEVRRLAGLSHRGLATVYDVCLDADRPFLVMRLVGGGSLRGVIDRGTPAPGAVAGLGTQLADVLAYVHARGMAHRAITPSTVLVDESGDAFLAAFTPAEADDELGPALDVHALGSVLLECLTGEPGAEVPEWLGQEWRDALTAMTAPSPADRPDAARCVDLLASIGDGETVVVPAAEPEPTAPYGLDLGTVTDDAGSVVESAAEPVVEPAAESAAERTVVVPAVPAPRAPQHTVRPTHAGLAGMGLAAAVVAVLLSTNTTSMSGTPAGDPRQPPVQQATSETATTPPTTATTPRPVTAAEVAPVAPARTRATRSGNSGRGNGHGEGRSKHKGGDNGSDSGDGSGRSGD